MDASVLLLRALYPLARRFAFFLPFYFRAVAHSPSLACIPARAGTLQSSLDRVCDKLAYHDTHSQSLHSYHTRTASRSTHTIHAQPIAPLIPYTHSHSLNHVANLTHTEHVLERACTGPRKPSVAHSRHQPCTHCTRRTQWDSWKIQMPAALTFNLADDR